MSEFKVGDKVVLRPETKPYTLTNFNGDMVEKSEILRDGFIYTVVGISKNDGDIDINHYGFSSICPHHLKHAEPTTKVEGVFDDFQSREIPSHNIDTTELRLSIFNAKPNRTLEEMQAIENWLLGEK